ncbi:GNAT family N-acetyltransferase [Nocardioides stalactiti]|uniref:GNAT family N-acetyltransferase n=1 Tax=Nocardioides stalactiti TaxID=2755356 RepID=UPI00160004A2|nr:GNAT family N-acetyltransferase [Nocardioides stalactiti]
MTQGADVEIAECVSDADLEDWRTVRLSVAPGERCMSVPELRAAASPRRLMVLARRDGVVVGSGLADDSDTEGAGFVVPRVMAAHRRTGVGSALLDVLATHCVGLGHPEVVSGVDDEGSLAFATRFGFAEVDREVEQTVTVGEEPEPPAPAGVEVVTLAERPELWDTCYDGFGTEVLADFAVHTPLVISAEQWSTTWRGDPMFLALDAGEVIGCAGLRLDPDHPDRAENTLTAVRRDHRGRGIAVHLKRLALHWAASHGVTTVSTWTQVGNTPMTTLNERLGYVTTQVSITVSRTLPMSTNA